MDRVTPLDLERPGLRKRFRGYDVRAVDALLKASARALHDSLIEAEVLRERLSAQAAELERARTQERLLHDVMSSAQQAADETRSTAHKQAEAILAESRMIGLSERLSAQRQLSDVKVELELLRSERVRFESELRSIIEFHLRELNARSLTVPSTAVVEVSAPALSVVEGEFEPTHAAR